MNFQLNKWYLDFTSAEETGYYYIMSFRAGMVNIGFSAIHHFSQNHFIKSSKICRVKKASIHKLAISNGELIMSPGSAQLRIDHENIGLNGIWQFKGMPLKMQNKPLFRTENGWCDWTVWTPHAGVKLYIIRGENDYQLSGSGYIDFVRFAFPFWKVPFRKLYWGRLHSQNNWIILFLLQTLHSTICRYADEKCRSDKLDVKVARDHKGNIRAMDWFIHGISQRPTNTLKIQTEVIRCLERQDLLNITRFSKVIPDRLLRWLGSAGTEEKLEVTAIIDGQQFRGILEEVSWHGR